MSANPTGNFPEIVPCLPEPQVSTSAALSPAQTQSALEAFSWLLPQVLGAWLCILPDKAVLKLV